MTNAERAFRRRSFLDSGLVKGLALSSLSLLRATTRAKLWLTGRDTSLPLHVATDIGLLVDGPWIWEHFTCGYALRSFGGLGLGGNSNLHSGPVAGRCEWLSRAFDVKYFGRKHDGMTRELTKLERRLSEY